MLKLLLLPLFVLSIFSAPPQAVQNNHAERIHQHTENLLAFAQKEHCSTHLGILVDMSIASRKKRFFIVNLQTDSILVAGLCAHGQGNDVNREEVVFSITPGSYCTSEGRYKVGAKFEGDYGTGYKLHGLDSTNNNALTRYIVFHSYFKVADNEDAKVVCRSNGCPMVSPAVFKASEKLIDAETKPVLMWIYK